jgi:hypothetical protein
MWKYSLFYVAAIFALSFTEVTQAGGYNPYTYDDYRV